MRKLTILGLVVTMFVGGMLAIALFGGTALGAGAVEAQAEIRVEVKHCVGACPQGGDSLDFLCLPEDRAEIVALIKAHTSHHGHHVEVLALPQFNCP